MTAIKNQAKNLFRKLYSRPVVKIDGEFDMIEDERQCLAIIENDLKRIKSQLCKEQRENCGMDLFNNWDKFDISANTDCRDSLYHSILNAKKP